MLPAGRAAIAPGESDGIEGVVLHEYLQDHGGIAPPCGRLHGICSLR